MDKPHKTLDFFVSLLLLTSFTGYSPIATAMAAEQRAIFSVKEIRQGGEMLLESLKQYQNYLLQMQGTLDSSSSILNSDNSRYQIHSFSGNAGQTITITLQSNDFDTYLFLLDANNNVLEENDDINQNNYNSQLTYTLPYTGTYNILANAYDSRGRGSYSLTVTAEQTTLPTAQPPQIGEFSPDQIEDFGCGVTLWRAGQADHNRLLFVGVYGSEPLRMIIDGRWVQLYSLNGEGLEPIGQRQSQTLQSQDGQITVQVDLNQGEQIGFETSSVDGTITVRLNGQETRVTVEGFSGC